MDISEQRTHSRGRDSLWDIDIRLMQVAFLIVILALILGWFVLIFFSPVYNLQKASPQSTSSIDQFTKAIELEPTNHTAYQYLAESYKFQGSLDAMSRVWENAIIANPEKKWPYQRLVEFYESTQQKDKVSDVWQMAVDNNSNTLWAYNALYDSYIAARNETASISVLQSAIQNNPDQLWSYTNLAKHYRSRKQWNLVEQTYRRAVQQFPNEANVYQLLGNHYISQKKWSDAENAYRASLVLDPEIAANYFNLGRSLLKLNQYEEATDSFEKAILLNPTTAYHRSLQKEYRQLSAEEQIESYVRILANAPDDVIVRRTLTNLYYEAEQCEQSIAVAKEGVTSTSDENSYQLLAYTLYQCEDIIGTIQVYKEAMEKFPDSATIARRLGRLQLETGQLSSAIQSFAVALKNNETPGSYRNVFQWYLAQVPQEQAIAAMEATIATAKPVIAQPYKDLIHKYNILGQTEESISVMQMATRANPQAMWAYLALAKQYIKYERIDEALRTYDRAIFAEPDNASVHHAKAKLLYDNELLPEAIESFKSASELAPDNSAMQSQLAGAYFASGQWERGARMLERIYSEYQSKSTYNYMRSLYQDTLGWPAEQPYQERAARLRWPSDSVTAFRNLANGYATMENLEAAEYNFQKAFAADPENMTTLNQLTSFSLTQSDCKSANKYGLQATQINPSSLAYLQLADVYATCGPSEAMEFAQRRSVENYLIEYAPQSNKLDVIARTIQRYRNVLPEEQVIAYLTNAIATFEFDHIHPHIQLAWYYEAEVDPPNPQEALVHYQQAVTKQPNYFTAVAAVGRLLHDGGEPEEAIPHYRKAILLRPNDQSVRARYGRALVETGEVEQGQTVLASALKLRPDDWYTNYAIEGYLTSLPPIQALGYVTETLTLVRPESEEVYMSPARYYLGLGNSDAAITILQLASKYNPRLDWPHVKLSYIYRQLKEYDLAVDEMLTAIERRPQVAWNYSDLGALYRERGNLEAALPNLAKAAELSPRNAWNHIYYGRVLFESGQTEAGYDALYLALERMPDEDVYGFAYALFKQYLTADDARSAYALLLEQNPNNELAQQYLERWLQE